jgi:hypothetical protein
LEPSAWKTQAGAVNIRYGAPQLPKPVIEMGGDELLCQHRISAR